MGKAETRSRMPPPEKERRKQTPPKSSHAVGFKDGSVRDSTVVSKIDLPNFRISDTLYKPVWMAQLRNGSHTVFCHLLTVVEDKGTGNSKMYNTETLAMRVAQRTASMLRVQRISEVDDKIFVNLAIIGAVR